jgi:polar amino acid transport system substrate-binding protein
MKKKFLTLITVVLALVMSLFAFVGCSGAPTKGFDVELMQAFCKANDIELELKKISWGQKEMEVNSGNIDLIWNGMTIRTEMANNLEVSMPYLTNSQVMVVRSDDDKNIGIASITANNAKITAESGSAGEAKAKEIFGNNSYNGAVDQITAMTEVLSKTSDVAIIDEVMANYYTTNDESSFKGKLKIVDLAGKHISLSIEEYGIAAKKGNAGLIAMVNDTIAKLYQDGTVKTIAQKYGIESQLIIGGYSIYVPKYGLLSAEEKASWENIKSKGKLVVGYTLFAPICY